MSDFDLIRRKRTQEFLERRKKSWNKIMKNHPEGLTKENHQQIKNEIKKEEARMKKENRNETKKKLTHTE